MASGGNIATTVDTLDALLLAIYKMDEATGNDRLQSSGNVGAADDLQEVNGPLAAATGQDNNAVDIEKDNSEALDEKTASDIGVGTNIISISTWVKVESFPQTFLAVVQSTNAATSIFHFIILLTSAGAIFAGYSDSGGTLRSLFSANGLITTGNFHHIAVVFNSTEQWISIWVDGTKDVNETAVGGVAGISSTAGSRGIEIGRQQSQARQYDGLVDELYIWIEGELTQAMVTELQTSFWSADVTPPAVPDKVTRHREQDADGNWHTGIIWRNPVDADLFGMHLGRALDSAAVTPTHILEDDGDGTVSWEPTGTSSDPYVLAGTSADTAPLQTESDRFGAWFDPDQSDDNAAFFVRAIDLTGNASAWTKAIDGDPDFPAEADVREGTTYDDGTQTGTLVPTSDVTSDVTVVLTETNEVNVNVTIDN